MYHWYKCIAAVFKRIIFNILTFFFISIIVLAKVKTERIGKDSFTVKKKKQQKKQNKKSRQKERKCGSKICKKNLVLIFVYEYEMFAKYQMNRISTNDTYTHSYDKQPSSITHANDRSGISINSKNKRNTPKIK